MPVGADTGFFFALQDLHPLAVEAWETREIITCSPVIFEIKRKLLKGEFQQWRTVLEDIENSMQVVPVTQEVALKAAHIAYGTGMPAMDSLILGALLKSGCTEIYTRDNDFELYRKKGINIINLFSQ